MKAVFPNSIIAKELQHGPDRLKYVVNHGLYPYFKDVLKSEVLKSSYLVVLFDESLNKST